VIPAAVRAELAIEFEFCVRGEYGRDSFEICCSVAVMVAHFELRSVPVATMVDANVAFGSAGLLVVSPVELLAVRIPGEDALSAPNGDDRFKVASTAEDKTSDMPTLEGGDAGPEVM
jgi:hypothetical protein